MNKSWKEILYSTLKINTPKQLDSDFYNMTKELKLKSKSRPTTALIWTSFATGITVLLVIIILRRPQIENKINIAMVEEIEILENIEVINELDNLTEDEFNYLLDSASNIERDTDEIS